MKFCTNYNSKSAHLVDTIIRSEELDATWGVEVDALGDSVIVATGPREDILVLRSVFEIVA